MATVGKTTIGGHPVTINQNFQQATIFTLPESGTVTDLNLYLTGQGAASSQVIRACMWAASGGVLGALKMRSNERTLFGNTTPAAWYTFTLLAPVALAAGDYGIGFVAGVSAVQLAIAADTVTNARIFKAVTYPSASDPFGTPGGSLNDQMSAYANYTPDALAGDQVAEIVHVISPY